MTKKKEKFTIYDYFTLVARKISYVAGTPWAFIVALLSIVIWLLSGEIFNYSDTWQLVINTGTTIVTFLMVFLIQNAQNRDSEAIGLKLDEILLKTTDPKSNDYIKVEELSEEEIKKLSKKFKHLRKKLK